MRTSPGIHLRRSLAAEESGGASSRERSHTPETPVIFRLRRYPSLSENRLEIPLQFHSRRRMSRDVAIRLPGSGRSLIPRRWLLPIESRRHFFPR